MIKLRSFPESDILSEKGSLLEPYFFHSITMTDGKEALFHGIGKPVVVLMAILALGGFLRLHHFSDWLHFELDQARDMRVIDEALSAGPGELTLLGMKAGGTSLRLGPGFYYLEYLSGLVFGATPEGVAMIVPILSIASIGLFYLFARRFFGTGLSLGLTLLFSVSAYLVMYGRFAWNPNPIPFFSLLGFYALLRSVAPEEHRPGRWFVLAAFSIGFATHLHFLAFLALPVVAAVFLAIRRPRFSWKAWGAACAAFLVFYVPVLLNEVETGGANSKAFFAAITEKSSKEEHTLPAKFVRNVVEHGLGYLVVVSGHESGGFFDVHFGGGEGFRVGCDERCRFGWKEGAAAIGIFGLGILSLFALWWRERERRKADVLLLSGIWFLVAFALFLPLSYGFSPRFFLVTAPIPFLLLGFAFEGARRALPWKRATSVATMLAISGLAALNLWYLADRFDQLSRAETEAVYSPTDRILKEKVRVTLAQQRAIVAYLKERSDESGWPVYMHSEPEHRRALKYILERSGVVNAQLNQSNLYREGIYVLILRSKSDLHDGMSKYLEKYDVIGIRPWGTLTMMEFRPKEAFVVAERQVFETTIASDNPSALPRYTWREWWERKNDAGNDTEETE
jgi:4-amino-4-deoxy-L-arabinose transferase-like glycosyltransferase